MAGGAVRVAVGAAVGLAVVAADLAVVLVAVEVSEAEAPGAVGSEIGTLPVLFMNLVSVSIRRREQTNG